MAAQNKKAYDLGVKLFQYLADGEKITEGLRHFFVVDAHETVVHPIVDERLAGRAFTLGDFVFVVRKLQVRAAAVDIKVFTQ